MKAPLGKNVFKYGDTRDGLESSKFFTCFLVRRNKEGTVLVTKKKKRPNKSDHSNKEGLAGKAEEQEGGTFCSKREKGVPRGVRKETEKGLTKGSSNWNSKSRTGS